MPQLFNADTGDHIGEISEAQLAFLVSEMEEESAEDQDYYIDIDMLEVLKEDGADPALVELIAKAIGGRQDISIRWEK